MGRPSAQARKVYQAEDMSGIFNPGEMIPNIRDVKKYVDMVVASDYVATMYPSLAYIEVTDGRGRKSGYGRGWSMVGGWFGEVKLPRFARTKQYILHEVAHVICGAKYGPHGHEHGFIKVYLGLVNEFLGKMRHDALTSAMIATGAVDRPRVDSRNKSDSDRVTS